MGNSGYEIVLDNKIELALHLYLRLKTRPKQHLGNGHYKVYNRPSLKAMLDILSIDYTTKPGKGLIFFHWYDCSEISKSILTKRLYKSAFEIIVANKPVKIASQSEYQIVNDLFALVSRTPNYITSNNILKLL